MSSTRSSIPRRIIDYFAPSKVQFDASRLPSDILEKILLRVDLKTLVHSGIHVSRQWYDVLQNKSFWMERARLDGADLSCFPTASLDVPLNYAVLYYYKPFNRNLIDNHSGQHGFNDWKIFNRGYSDRMKVEHPPVYCEPHPSLDTKFCFVTSFAYSEKTMIIDFRQLGVHAEVLDRYRPHITVSEWCTHRNDCAAMYDLSVVLLDEDSEELLSDDKALTSFHFHREMRQWDDYDWQKAEHVFQKYPAGVRKVMFISSGQDRQFWKGHYGSKMAHASVRLEFVFDECTEEE